MACVKSVLWPALFNNVVDVSLSGGSLGYWTACNNIKRYCTVPYCECPLLVYSCCPAKTKICLGHPLWLSSWESQWSWLHSQLSHWSGKSAGMKIYGRINSAQRIHSLLLSQMVDLHQWSACLVYHTWRSEFWVYVSHQWLQWSTNDPLQRNQSNSPLLLSSPDHLGWTSHRLSFAMDSEAKDGWWEVLWAVLVIFPGISHTAPLHSWLQHWVLARR